MRALIGGLVCVWATTAYGQYQFTPAEAAQAQKLASQVNAKCQQEIQATVTKQKEATGATPWIAGASQAYCGCMSDSVRNDLTPALLRSAQKEAFKKFLSTAADQCAAAEFKNSFPSICRSWFGEPAKDGIDAKEIETRLNRFCECAQKPVDDIPPKRFAEIMGATTQDFADYKRSPDGFMSIRPGSLMPQWLACRQVNYDKPTQ